MCCSEQFMEMNDATSVLYIVGDQAGIDYS